MGIFAKRPESPHSTKDLAAAINGLNETTKALLAWFKAHENTEVLTALKEMEKHIMAGQAEIQASLQKIDDATNKLAANVAVIADVNQEVSDDLDALIDALKPGTVITEEQIAKLQQLALRTQQASDASDAQVEVLKAIAKKYDAPVPIPVPEPPVIEPNE